MSKLRQKISKKSERLVKNMNEDARLMKSMGAFSESSMYLSDYEVRDTLRESGIMDTYSSMSSYDEWN